MIERLKQDQVIMVAAHRGWKSSYPENTLLAFQKALELGVDMIELDLRLSKDGIVVVIHDATLDRTTNGSGMVSSHTLAELKQCDAGGWFKPEFEGLEIPTFEEFCQLLQQYPDVLLNVEIKPAPDAIEAADQAIRILEKFDCISRSVFTCFDAAVLSYIHEAYNLKTQGFPGEKMSNFVSGQSGTYSNMWAVGIEMSLLTPEIVQEFQGRGIMVWSYCPDVAVQVQYSLECGVTGMTCNDPQPAMQILRERRNQAEGV